MPKSHKMGLAQDTVLYMIVKVIEGVLGIVILSVYAKLFDTTLFGKYTLINTTVTITGMVAIQWLLQSVIRYVNTFIADNKEKDFYSTAFTTWLLLNVGMITFLGGALLVAVTFFKNTEFVSGFLASFRPQWLWLGLIAIVTFNTSELLIGLMGALRKIRLNLLLSLGATLGKLIIPVVLVWLYGARIEWILLANIICHFIIIVVAFVCLDIRKFIAFSQYNKKVLQVFCIYGFPLIGNYITTTILNNSDRYIIQYFSGAAEVAIYQLSYSIPAAAFTAINTAVMKGSYPNILKAWSQDDKPLVNELISQAVRNYLLVGVPAVVGISTLAKYITNVMYGPEKSIGYPVLIFVALGLFFLGITEYSNKYWELNSRTHIIFRNSLIAGALNIMLNIVFIPTYGFVVAAVSTFLGYLAYFLLSRFQSRKYIKWNLSLRTYVSIFGSAAAMGAVLYILTNIVTIPMSFLSLAFAVGVGFLVYAVTLLLSGEIKGELSHFAAIVKKSKKG